MKTTMIYPELGEKTNATIEYKCSYNGGFYLTNDLNLKGRGIKMVGDGSTHKRNKKTYQNGMYIFLFCRTIPILKHRYCRGYSRPYENTKYFLP